MQYLSKNMTQHLGSSSATNFPQFENSQFLKSFEDLAPETGCMGLQFSLESQKNPQEVFNSQMEPSTRFSTDCGERDMLKLKKVVPWEEALTDITSISVIQGEKLSRNASSSLNASSSCFIVREPFPEACSSSAVIRNYTFPFSLMDEGLKAHFGEMVVGRMELVDMNWSKKKLFFFDLAFAFNMTLRYGIELVSQLLGRG